MLLVETAYVMLVILISLIATTVAYRHGKQLALGVAMVLTLLAGTWMKVDVLELPLDVRTTTAAIFLVAFCAHSPRLIFSPLTVVDFLIAALAITHVISDTYHGESFWLNIGRAYAEWVLPYVAGRYAFIHRGSIASLTPWFLAAGLLISLAAIYESWSGCNVWDQFIAPKDDRVTHSIGRRYDLFYRATAMTRHSIFLGTTLVLLLPWCISLFETASTKIRKGIAVVVFITILLGICSSLSRGPILELLVVALFAANVRFAWLRWICIPTAIAAVAIGFTFLPEFTSWTERVTHDIAYRTVINTTDGAEIFSSTRGRAMVYQVYSPAFFRAGLLGYGTEAITGSQPSIPYPSKYKEAYQILKAIDNSWLHLGLRFGWIAVFILAMLFLTSIWTLLTLMPSSSTYFFPNGKYFISSVAAVLFATAIQIATVYFSYEYAFWLLFSFGMVSGLRSQVFLTLGPTSLQRTNVNLRRSKGTG